MKEDQIKVSKYYFNIVIKHGPRIANLFLIAMQKWEGRPVMNCYYDKDVLDMKLKEVSS